MINKKITSITTAILAFLALPLASAYPMGLQMPNLWDVFVEALFGSFFIAVMFLCLIFFIILMLGSISYFTVIAFLLFFILAMVIGYGYSLFSFIIIVGGVVYLIYQVIKFLSNM